MYRYLVVIEDTLKFNEYRQMLNSLYGWGWDGSRHEEVNIHWAQGMFYRAWTLYLRGDEELATLILIS